MSSVCKFAEVIYNVVMNIAQSLQRLCIITTICMFGLSYTLNLAVESCRLLLRMGYQIKKLDIRSNCLIVLLQKTSQLFPFFSAVHYTAHKNIIHQVTTILATSKNCPISKSKPPLTTVLITRHFDYHPRWRLSNN